MQLVDSLRREILSMPNANFRIREEDLAKKFGVSRSPVREALRQLENERLIDRRRKKGITLRRFTTKEVADIYDLRGVLEGYAARLVAERASAVNIAELRQAAEAYRATQREGADPVLRAKLDDKFHSLLVRLAGNEQMTDLHNNFSVLKLAFSFYMDSSRKSMPLVKTPYPHESIIDTIARGDSDGAEKILRQHCQFAKQVLLENFSAISFDSGV